MANSPDRKWHPLPTTHWTEVGRAGDADPAVRRQAMARLVQRYLPALRSHLVARRRVDPDAADDLLQAFVADRVLGHDLFAAADPARGRFRSFLLTCLDRFVANAHRAGRRGPLAKAGDLAAAEPADPDFAPDAADAAFDVPWARQVLAEALRLTREECVGTGRAAEWGLFEARVVRPTLDQTPAPGYDQLVARFGFRSPAEATNTLATAKRRFARVLRAVVGEYAKGPDAVEAEIADLIQILSRAGR